MRKTLTTILAIIIMATGIIGFIPSKSNADTYNQGVVTFVTSLYSDCLFRTPDSVGLNDWCNKLVTGQVSGKQCAYGFFFSQEFIDHVFTTKDELINVYYKVFLNRAADPSGLAYWRNKISGVDFMADITILFQGFADSTEFANKCASYGITAGASLNLSAPATTPSSGSSVPNSAPTIQDYINQGWVEYTLDLGHGKTQRLLYRTYDCTYEYNAINNYRAANGWAAYEIFGPGTPQYDYAVVRAINACYDFGHAMVAAKQNQTNNDSILGAPSPYGRGAYGENVANNIVGEAVFNSFLNSAGHNWQYRPSSFGTLGMTVASVECLFILPDGTITTRSPGLDNSPYDDQWGEHITVSANTSGRSTVELFW